MESRIAELLKAGNDAPRSVRMSGELKLLVRQGSESRGVSADRFIRLAVVNALVQDGFVDGAA
jgi:hypothetical protein